MGTKNHRGSDSAGASRLLCLKANHPTLFQQIDTWFETARAEGTLPIPSEHTAEAGIIAPKSVKCGRSHSTHCPPCIRQRNGWDCKQLSSSNVPAICGIKPLTIQFYLSSLPSESPRIAAAIRQHWGIENSLHWTLDAFGEDDCRVRSLHAPHNLALLRRFAVNTLNRESTFKRSLKQKSKPPCLHAHPVGGGTTPSPQETPPSCQ